MKLTHIKTGKKYEVGGKKVKSDTTYYTNAAGNRVQRIKEDYEAEAKKKDISKMTPKLKAPQSSSVKKPIAKATKSTYSKVIEREIPSEMNKVEPRKPMLTKIDYKPSIGNIKKIETPKTPPTKYETPKSKPLKKVKGQDYRKEYQVPTGFKGNKPTMSSMDRKKGGGKNKLKIGI